MKKRLTIPQIKECKNKMPLACLTAYTFPMAQMLNNHADLILVGDSLGMVLYGYDSTLPVTLEMMCQHGKAVVKGAPDTCVVIDMPFGSYQQSPAHAFKNSAHIMQETGCQAVKLEGGEAMAETIAFLNQRGIPVMGHVGMQPQSMHVNGGFKTAGKTDAARQQILADAKAVEQAGAFALVIEAVPVDLAEEITATIQIPTIGIGASGACDGQILVTEDMLGCQDGNAPKFVKKFANVHIDMKKGVASYVEAVRKRAFPATEHTYQAADRIVKLKTG